MRNRVKPDAIGVLPAATLSELCAEAAEHVAHARIMLFDESLDPEHAMLHLDEAISCLKRLPAYGQSKARHASVHSA